MLKMKQKNKSGVTCHTSKSTQTQYQCGFEGVTWCDIVPLKRPKNV